MLPSSVSARSGCCSWHGGVCGSSCCDGTPLSAKCGGGYFYEEDTYYVPPPPTYPSTIKASFYPSPNDDGSTFNIIFDVKDPNFTAYSAVISKCAGCDPGPLTDFTSNPLYFENVAPGTWYVNVKKTIGGRWSTVAYWTITVPQWYPPSPTPTPTPELTLTSTKSTTDTLFETGSLIIVVIFFLYIGVVTLFMVVRSVLSWIRGLFK